MSELFRPATRDPLFVEIRRLVVAGLTIAVVSVCWHALRPGFIHSLACSSVGAPGRERLLTWALLEQNTPGLSPVGGRIEEYWTDWVRMNWVQASSFCTLEPKWVMWTLIYPGEYKSTTDYRGIAGFTDDLLHPQGRVALGCSVEAPPMDADGDGLWEFVSYHSAIPPQQADVDKRDVSGWAVIRLGTARNEIAWAGLTDQTVWARSSAIIKPMWRDEDGDGVKELVFLTVVAVYLPNGDVGFQPPRTVAVFAWDKPGGVLRPRMLPEDGSLLSWTPPQDKPLSVAQDADPDAVLRELFPIPSGFGDDGTTATQPATAPQSRPASSPA